MPNDLMLRARISPKGHLDLLSRQEVTALLQVNSGPLARIFRNCSLAVLNHDEYQIDDDQALLERYPDYEVQVIQDERGIKLELRNAPAAAFVDGELIRKCLAETAAEVVVQLKPPPQRLFNDSQHNGPSNYLRFRLSPRSAIALAARVKRSGKEFIGEQRELFLLDEYLAAETPYERLLGEAMMGNGALFIRQDAVEAAWAVVEPILESHPLTQPYAPGSWGPRAADRLIINQGGWFNPLT